MGAMLLTGGAGYLGRHVMALLSATERRIVVVAHRWSDRQALEQLVGDTAIDRCMHLGWYAHPADYLHAVDGNRDSLDASLDLVSVLLDRGCSHLVVAGSSAEYGCPSERVDEAARIEPHTIYAAAKTSLRLLLESSWLDGRMTVAWARIFNVVGPGEHPDRIVPLVTRSLLARRAVDLSDGRQVRDILHVTDVARALVALSDSGSSGIFNVSSGVGVDLRTVFTALAGRVGAPTDLLRFGARARGVGDPDRLVGMNARLREKTAWSPAMDLDAVLNDVVAWWRSRAGDASLSAGAGR